MLMLTRTVRFAVNSLPAPSGSHADLNGFAGVPSMRGLGRHYELHITCRGEPDPATGYLINIRDIDRAARDAALPIIEKACREAPNTEPARLMPSLVDALRRSLGAQLASLRWNLSPYYQIEMSTHDPTTAIIRQQFDFAAAHRLHAPSMSDAENRDVFGKCNNPNGHGHNYRLEPAVEISLQNSGRLFTLQDLERIVDEVIIRRFDHTHLNEDTSEFATNGGLNPSVENIARIFHGLLAPVIKDASRGGAALRVVTVWETEKTSCTYPG